MLLKAVVLEYEDVKELNVAKLSLAVVVLNDINALLWEFVVTVALGCEDAEELYVIRLPLNNEVLPNELTEDEAGKEFPVVALLLNGVLLWGLLVTVLFEYEDVKELTIIELALDEVVPPNELAEDEVGNVLLVVTLLLNSVLLTNTLLWALPVIIMFGFEDDEKLTVIELPIDNEVLPNELVEDEAGNELIEDEAGNVMLVVALLLNNVPLGKLPTEEKLVEVELVTADAALALDDVVEIFRDVLVVEVL